MQGYYQATNGSYEAVDRVRDSSAAQVQRNLRRAIATNRRLLAQIALYNRNASVTVRALQMVMRRARRIEDATDPGPPRHITEELGSLAALPADVLAVVVKHLRVAVPHTGVDDLRLVRHISCQLTMDEVRLAEITEAIRQQERQNQQAEGRRSADPRAVALKDVGRQQQAAVRAQRGPAKHAHAQQAGRRGGGRR
jgi:hypothetical protein